MFKNIKFTTKLFFSMVTMTLTALIITSWSAIYMAKGGLFTLGEKGIVATHQAVYTSIEEAFKTLEPKLREDIELFSLTLNAGNIFIDESSSTKTKIKNQKTGEESFSSIPQMSLNGTPLWQDETIVDRIAQATKAEVTLFQLVDNKLLRIATTFKKNGKRITGSYIPSDNPIFKAILNRENFMGKITLFGEDLMTLYAPLTDATGKIIGAIFAGRPVITKEIRDVLKRCKIGNGYFFAYKPDGFVLEHPAATGKNIFDSLPQFKGVEEGFISYVNSDGKKKVTYVKYLDSADMFIAVGMDHYDIMDGLDTKMLRNSILIGLGLLIVVVAITLFVVRTINRPLQQLAEKTSLVGDGDYTVEFDSKVEDSIGLLTRSLGQMTQKGNKVMHDIRSSAQALAAASTELATVSSDMVANADESTAVSEEAARNAATVSENMHSVSSAMEESTINLDTIASASEEMGNTIQEIASNSARARATTEEAVESAKRSHEDVQKLGEAAKSIGSITETITDISEQTNLLALNATIEAARAGEAGKGFAVVANEIKELAKGTAEATGKIRTAIEGIQSQTSNTVEEISKIASVIEDVNEIVTTIVTAVEEQSITTNEIVGNVAQASQGIGEINENVANSNQMTAEVTAGVEEVKEKSSSVKANSEQVSSAAIELSQLSEKLTEMVGQFKI